MPEAQAVRAVDDGCQYPGVAGGENEQNYEI